MRSTRKGIDCFGLQIPERNWNHTALESLVKEILSVLTKTVRQLTEKQWKRASNIFKTKDLAFVGAKINANTLSDEIINDWSDSKNSSDDWTFMFNAVNEKSENSELFAKLTANEISD